jgi:hypothetical protein
MDTLPIAHCPVGINLSVLPFRSDQDKFSERMFFDEVK